MKPSNTLRDYKEYLGGLSRPSKMPGLGYSLPARYCKTGQRYRDIKGSVCSRCYAKRGNYTYNNVQSCLEQRYHALMVDPEGWRDLMIEQIGMAFLHNTRKKDGQIADGNFFRWHDSGDFQGAWHVKLCNEIALALPHISFWAPTKEYHMVRVFLRDNKLAPNFIVRCSSMMLGKPALCTTSQIPWTSTVDSHKGHRCPAPKQAGQCGDCRACWDKQVVNVDYHLH